MLLSDSPTLHLASRHSYQKAQNPYLGQMWSGPGTSANPISYHIPSHSPSSSQPGLPIHLSFTLSPGPWHTQLLCCPKSSRTSQPLLLCMPAMPFLFLSALFFLTLAVKPCSGITSFQLSHGLSHQLTGGAFSFLFGAPHPAKHRAHSRHSAAGGQWKPTSQSIDLWEGTVLCSNLIIPKSLF